MKKVFTQYSKCGKFTGVRVADSVVIFARLIYSCTRIVLLSSESLLRVPILYSVGTDNSIFH